MNNLPDVAVFVKSQLADCRSFYKRTWVTRFFAFVSLDSENCRGFQKFGLEVLFLFLRKKRGLLCAMWEARREMD